MIEISYYDENPQEQFIYNSLSSALTLPSIRAILRKPVNEPMAKDTLALPLHLMHYPGGLMKMKSILIVLSMLQIVSAYRLDDVYGEYLNISTGFEHHLGEIAVDGTGVHTYRLEKVTLTVERELKRFSWWGEMGAQLSSFDTVTEFGFQDISVGAAFYLRRASLQKRWRVYGAVSLPLANPKSGQVISSPKLIPQSDTEALNGFTTGSGTYTLGTSYRHKLFPLKPTQIGWYNDLSVTIPNAESFDVWFQLHSEMTLKKWRLVTPALFTHIYMSRHTTQTKGKPLSTIGLGLYLHSERRVSLHSTLHWGVSGSEISTIRNEQQFRQQVPENMGISLRVTYSIPTKGDDDRDGVPNRLDNCIYKAEDLDGYMDRDGCPEDDNDSDGILDSIDQCPLKPEDFDQFEDEDGCPEEDNDNDGISDSLDQCPLKAEDTDRYKDEDGCPDDDNDKDDIVDVSDSCPLLPEIYNGFMDSDGCPDSLPQKERIIVLGAVHFAKDSYELTQRDSLFLTALSKRIEKMETKRILIVGHTDSDADEVYNETLGMKRALKVKAFFEIQGITKEILLESSKGESEPFTTSQSKPGFAINRRVEIHIEREIDHEE